MEIANKAITAGQHFPFLGHEHVPNFREVEHVPKFGKVEPQFREITKFSISENLEIWTKMPSVGPVLGDRKVSEKRKAVSLRHVPTRDEKLKEDPCLCKSSSSKSQRVRTTVI